MHTSEWRLWMVRSLTCVFMLVAIGEGMASEPGQGTAQPKTIILTTTKTANGPLYTITEKQTGRVIASQMTERELELMFPRVWANHKHRRVESALITPPAPPQAKVLRKPSPEPAPAKLDSSESPSMATSQPESSMPSGSQLDADSNPKEEHIPPILSPPANEVMAGVPETSTNNPSPEVGDPSPDQQQPPETVGASAGEEPTMAELVGEAVAGAEEASTKAGVAYYGKDRTGILGNRLWFADAGVIISSYDGSDAEIDPGVALSTGYNFPAGKYVDLGFGVGYAHQSGTVLYYENMPYTVYDLHYSYYYYYYTPRTAYRPVLVVKDFDLSSFTGNGTITFSLAPENKVNPFVIGGAYFVSQDLTIGSDSYSTSDGGYLIGGGLEIELSKKATFVPSVVHSEAGDAKETSLGGLLSIWYAFRHAFRISIAHGTESESTIVRGGIMYSF